MESSSRDEAARDLTMFLSRRPWAPLDCAAVSPGDLEALGARPLARLGVDLGEARLCLLAVPDDGVEDGHVLLPPWVGAVLSAADAAPVRVRVLPDTRAAAAPTSGEIEVDGPFAGAADAALAPVLALARPHLAGALARQLARSGLRPVPGAWCAARISGQVLAFRFKKFLHSETGVQQSTAEEVCCPSVVRVSQAPPPANAPRDLEAHRAAATACLRALREHGAFQAVVPGAGLGPGAGAARVLLEGGPPAGHAPAFLHELRQAAEAEGYEGVAHLPVGPLLWEAPPGGLGDRALAPLLRGFIRNALPERAGGLAPRLLVLWGLDGPLPEGAGAWIDRALAPLSALPADLALLGLCASRPEVPAALRRLFEDAAGGQGDKVGHLGLRRSKVALEAKAAATAPPEVLGCGAIQSRLKASVVRYYSDHALFRRMGADAPPRVLLHGPPGAGKTHLLRWLCAALPAGVSSSWLHPGQVWSRYLGESEEKVRTAFAQATRGGTGEGSVLLLEGLDQLAPGGGRAGQESDALRDRLVATLLTCLDGVDGPAPGSGPGLGVIATSCTRAEDLDSRVTRPGRMDVWIHLPAPGPEDRIKMLRHLVEGAGRAGAREADSCGGGGSDEGHLESLASPGELLGEILRLSDGWCPGRLQLAASRAWTLLPGGRAAPGWSEVLGALRALGGQRAAPAPPTGGPALFAACAGRTAGPSAPRTAEADVLASRLLDFAAAVAVPSDDDDEL